MRIQLNYNLDKPLDEVWSQLQMVSTLEYVANPILKFEAVNPSVLPKEWTNGDYEKLYFYSDSFHSDGSIL